MSKFNMDPRANPTKSAILFDLDGTLVNNVPLLVECVQKALLKVLNQSVTLEEVKPHIGKSLESYLCSVLPAMMIDKEQGINMLRAEYERQYAAAPGRVTAFNGIVSCLDALHGKSNLGVVTSRVNNVPEDLAQAGLAKYFDEVITGQDTTERKPNPQPLILAARRLGALTTNCVYVGDAISDILAAQAAGMESVAVTYGVHERLDFETVKPDHLVSSPLGLQVVLQQMLPMDGGYQP